MSMLTLYKSTTAQRLFMVALLSIIFLISHMTYYVASVITAIILLVLIYKRRENQQQHEKMNKRVAEAMANKIKFEADQHRKSRERYNYIKLGANEEE